MNKDSKKTENEQCSIPIMPCYFKPITDLFYITKNKKYLIKYTKKGREIIDNRGLKRIVRPLSVELSR